MSAHGAGIRAWEAWQDAPGWTMDPETIEAIDEALRREADEVARRRHERCSAEVARLREALAVCDERARVIKQLLEGPLARLYWVHTRWYRVTSDPSDDRAAMVEIDDLALAIHQAAQAALKGGGP